MEIIKKNWKLKLLSLVIAIFLWSYIIATTNPTVNVRMNDIPIIFENVDNLTDNELILSSDVTKSVNLTVSGQRSDIIDITSQHIRVSADFIGLDEGIHTVNLKYSLPSGIRIVDAPSSINANIEKILSREMAVEVNSIGKLQDNYVTTSSQILPEKISIRGARSNLDRVDKLVVDLDLSSLTKDITVNKEIKAIDEEGNTVSGITYGQQFVNLSMFVELQKEVEIIPITTGELNSEYRVDSIMMNKSQALVQGPEDVINNLESIHTQEINISDYTESTQIPVDLNLTSDVSLVNEDTSYMIDLTIEQKIDKTIEYPVESIEIKNNKNNYDYTFNNTTIPIILHGFSEELDLINQENIKLSLDFSDVKIGQNLIEANVSINNEDDKGLIKNPIKIDVKISNKNI